MENGQNQGNGKSTMKLRLLALFAMAVPLMVVYQCTAFSRAFEAQQDRYSFNPIFNVIKECSGLKPSEYEAYRGGNEGCNFYLGSCSSMEVGDQVMGEKNLFVRLVKVFSAIDNEIQLVVNIYHHEPDELVTYKYPDRSLTMRVKQPVLTVRIVKLSAK